MSDLSVLIDDWNTGNNNKQQHAKEALLKNEAPIFFVKSDGPRPILDKVLCLEGEVFWQATRETPEGGRTFQEILIPKKQNLLQACPATGVALFQGVGRFGKVRLDWSQIQNSMREFVAFTRDVAAPHTQTYNADEAADLLHVLIKGKEPGDRFWEGNKAAWESLQKRLKDGKSSIEDLLCVKRVAERCQFVAIAKVESQTPIEPFESPVNIQHKFANDPPLVVVLVTKSDIEGFNRLKVSLAGAIRAGIVQIKNMDDVPAGATYDIYTAGLVAKANIVAIILTSDFLNDPICNKLADQAQDSGKLIVPILYRSVDLQYVRIGKQKPLWIGQLRGLPECGFMSQNKADEQWVEIAKSMVSLARAVRT